MRGARSGGKEKTGRVGLTKIHGLAPGLESPGNSAHIGPWFPAGEEDAMAELTSLREAIAHLVRDGQAIAMEGFTHLIPHAAGHELIRQGKRDLTLIRMTPDVIYDQLIGMGCARKLVFSWGGNPGVGSLHRFRDAVENGWPRAAGVRGEALAAVPAKRPDVTVIHAQKADRRGNVMMWGIIGVQKEAVLAATHSIVTVEEVVDELDAPPNAGILPHWGVSAVCEVPGGAP